MYTTPYIPFYFKVAVKFNSPENSGVEYINYECTRVVFCDHTIW